MPWKKIGCPKPSAAILHPTLMVAVIRAAPVDAVTFLHACLTCGVPGGYRIVHVIVALQ
jgi:hypothetical protein